MDPTILIADIKEKEATEPKAPSFPQIKSTGTGFPEHKKRTRISAFKSKRQATPATKPSPPNHNLPLKDDATPQPPPSNADESPESKERRRIDRENNDKLASMSPEEIEEAQKELFGSLDPATLERLLKRANLDDGTSPFDMSEPALEQQKQQPQDPPPQIRIEDTSTRPSPSSRNLHATVEDEPERSDSVTSAKKTAAGSTEKQVRFADPEPPAEPSNSKPATVPDSSVRSPVDDDAALPTPPAEQILHPTDSSAPRPHWPHPPQPDTDGAASAGVDLNDPDFLEKLHQKYFPSLPADPSKLAWMAPLPTPGSEADQDSPYYPGQLSVAAAALRFDFRGALLPPRLARLVPTSKGLHHHGEAPEAAGYTIPELARLARSAVPGQRCVAYQTLGRLLYRLGRGEFGRPGDPMADGLWALAQEGAVLRSLTDEASLEEGRGHRSARAFAIEAVWLFEKGGWKERVRRGK